MHHPLVAFALLCDEGEVVISFHSRALVLTENELLQVPLLCRSVYLVPPSVSFTPSEHIRLLVRELWESGLFPLHDPGRKYCICCALVRSTDGIVIVDSHCCLAVSLF